MKLYKCGLVVGRFQMFHKGHEQMIQTALELCEQVVVFIGYNEDKASYKDPFSRITRVVMVREVFEDQVKQGKLYIACIPDIGVGDNTQWGSYVLEKFQRIYGDTPVLFITGSEPGRLKWFDDSNVPKLDKLILSRKDDISASKCRECLKNGQREEWEQMVPSELHDMFDGLNKIIKTLGE
jgi:cytidyltransferase-like protein